MIIKRKYFSLTLRDSGKDIDLGGGLVMKQIPLNLVGKLLRNIPVIRRRQDTALLYNVYFNGEKIGYIHLGEEKPEEIYINWLGIDKKYRGNHYATRVMEKAIEFIKSLKKYKIITLEWDRDDPSAYHIYKKLGFVEDKNSNPEDELLVMHKRIG